jgi:hypothetical protein
MSAPESGAPLETARVLIADGDTAMAAALADAIRQRMLDVDVVSTVADAIERLSQVAYTVAVVELAILEEGSRGVAALLSTMGRSERPIVLATTEGPRRSDLDADLIQVVVRKPIRTGDVAEMIRACVSHAPAMRGAAMSSRRPRLDLHRL